MNERIKKLTKQSGVDAGQLFAEMLCNDSDVNVKIAEAWNAQPDDVRQRIFQVIEQKQEKFAELIVRECADVAKYHTPDTKECGYTWLIHNKIKQHFGVFGVK